jgi:hypothetical protein
VAARQEIHRLAALVAAAGVAWVDELLRRIELRHRGDVA